MGQGTWAMVAAWTQLLCRVSCRTTGPDSCAGGHSAPYMCGAGKELLFKYRQERWQRS